jgi:catechol 2,3-dioxygenase-like lactoylglutathione lyase family enzyme
MKFHALAVRIATPDLERLIAFYRGVLGFAIDLHTGGFAILRHGPIELQLYLEEGFTGPAVRGLFLETEGVTELFERVKDRAKILWGPEVYSYQRREFSAADPDGNELIFSEETSDRPTVDEP